MPTRRSPLALTVALLALLASPHAGARTLPEIRAAGVLRVATPGDIPSFTLDNAGQYAGFEVDLVRLLAADLGVRVSFETVPIDGLLTRLQEDRADVAISALGITRTRENRTDFTAPTACAGVSLLSLDPRLNRHTDLVGKTIGVSAGSIMQAYAQKLPFEKRVNVYATSNDLMFAVLSRAVDATFVYSVMEPGLKKTFPKANIHLGPELWSVPTGIMLREDNDSTRLALNAGLGRVMQGGAYAALSQKYFGKDVRCKS
ncbi:ABC transporter substrate-binding protein [Deinococcus planocerae]|uniref:ABC transporter substrate-binding protein n=1 Tax=Deinococcus planocerae TaxID=1737569 RepID=UPI000C7E98A5|nr:ABC transporter substrate-binding protein [Deinococcus planocerae]